MDAQASRRLIATNVQWPLDRFFIPPGGLAQFLHENLRFKVFVLMTCLFCDGSATETVGSLDREQRAEIRARVRDLFFAAQIRQNEFRVALTAVVVPGEASWMFHIMLVIFHVIGFDGDDSVLGAADGLAGPEATELKVANAQATFLLGAALTTYLQDLKDGRPAVLDYPDYDHSGMVSRQFSARMLPASFDLIPQEPMLGPNFDMLERLAAWRFGTLGLVTEKTARVSGDDAEDAVFSEASLVHEIPRASCPPGRVTEDRPFTPTPPGLPKKPLPRRTRRRLPSSIVVDNGAPISVAFPPALMIRRGGDGHFVVHKQDEVDGFSSSGSMPELRNVSETSDYCVARDNARQFVVFPTLMSSGSFIDVGVLADILRALLLAPEQLRDRHWMPDTTVAVFLRKRVRPVVYFLQVLVHGRPTERRASADLSPSEEQNVRMVILNMLGTVRLLGRARFIATEQIRCRGLPLVDVAEVGRDFGIPAQSTRMFAIIFDLLERFPPQDDADRQAYSLMGPILANLQDLARREAIRSGEPTEFPEYDVRGDITVDGTAFQFPAIAGDMHGVRGKKRVIGGGDGREVRIGQVVESLPKSAKATTFLAMSATEVLRAATSRFAVREEFQNLDIPTLGALHEFSCLPFIRRLVAEQLEPMLQYYVRIREQLVKSLKARPETDRNMTRQWLRSYMEHAGNLSDVIIRYKDLADARRIPTPPIPWLQIIMRAEQKFGFAGDEEPIPRANAVDQMFIGDGTMKIAEIEFSGRDPINSTARRLVIPRRTMFPPLVLARSRKSVAFDQTILARLSYAAEIRREAIEYSHAKDGVIAYIVQVLRPFAELIHVCIPSNALSVDQLPFGTYEQLRRFVVEFITQAGIVYDIAVEHAKAFRLSLQHIDSRAVWSLSLALNFDARFGNISAGYHPHTREHSISRVRSALTLANNSSGADLDVDLSMLLNSLPRVPAWNRGDIELLMQREKVDEWAGELELLNDNIIAADNLGNALAKSAQRRADATALLFVRAMSAWLASPIHRPEPGVMSLGELAVLWVKRARHLGQSLLRVVLVSYAVDLPANCVALLRTGIRVLMLNMIILAKASVMYGPYGPTSVPRFFVPAESTTLFGMAEGMVDRFGYEGDEEEGPRQRMFQNMETLYGSMLLNRHYSRFGYDFPGFPVADADLAKFGIHPLIKNAQLSRLLLDRNGKKHNFGDELLRYNPELGEEGRWVVALPSEGLEKTRPNTPEDGDLSRISEGDEGEGDDVEPVGRLSVAEF
ncbi:hypothetical protein B0H15DRAFT_807551 [Mycena belliarum]|uniref:Uncharacterized protein n=1 Tax=Mycena belliarum TaxID=1033014 RepID=A0AAD6TN86_9AGAR|nr:hypothetical protein B0H15DRAFT_807551 [Mycena belliae]